MRTAVQITKRIFMGWVNTKPKHSEDQYKTSSVLCSPGDNWVRVYAYVDESVNPERSSTGLTNCHHCGGLMNEAQRYLCGCPQCVEAA